MMRNLGEFGVTHEPEDYSFSYFGEEVRAHPLIGPLLMDEMMELALKVDAEMQDSEGVPTPEAMTFTKGFVKKFVHPDDFEKFWHLAMVNRQSQEEVASVGYKVIAALTERPTERPSDSSDGPQPTAPSLKDVSYSRVMKRLEGRPDLQLVVMDVRERREDLASTV